MFVLLDSNVWLAALAHDGFCRRVVNAAAPLCSWVITPYICAEVREQLVTKFRRMPREADALVEALASKPLLREHGSDPVPELRDPDDEPILAAAVRYGCAFLVTGDKDLLALGGFAGVQIVTVRECASRLALSVE